MIDILLDRGLQLLSRCFDIWVGSDEKNPKPPNRPTRCKVSNHCHCPQTDISKSKKSPPLRRFSEDFQAATLANQTTLWALSPNLRSILYERSKWKEKARAPHLFRFLWELYKCLINKKVGWLWKIAICLNSRDVVVVEFWIFVWNFWRVYVAPKNTCRSKWFHFYVGFLVGILIDGAS